MGNVMQICQFDSNVYWIGEDERGDVTIVGNKYCVVRNGTHPQNPMPYHGVPLRAFVSGSLLTMNDAPDGCHVNLPNSQVALIPGSTSSYYDSCWQAGSPELLILMKERLCKVNLNTGVRSVIAAWEIDDDLGPYEKVTLIGDRVIAFRYGFSVWKMTGEFQYRDESSVSELAASRDGRVFAGNDNGALRIFYTNTLKTQVEQIPHNLRHLDFVGGDLIGIWGEGSNIVAGVLQEGSWNTKSLPENTPESFSVIPSLSCLAIGMLSGVIMLWFTKTNEHVLIDPLSASSVRQLYWSISSNRLFVGCKNGAAFSIDIRPFTQ